MSSHFPHLVYHVPVPPAAPADLVVSPRRARVLAALGVLLLSFDALHVRLASVPAPDVLVWRGGLTLLGLGAWTLWRRREALRNGPLWVSAIIVGIDSGLFVWAIDASASVANALILLTTAPLQAALLGGLVGRDRVPLRTWLALFAAGGGVVFAFGDRVGGSFGTGELVALAGAFLMALNLNWLRRRPDVPRVPAVAMAGGVTLLVALPWATFAPPTAVGLTAMLLMGAVLLPASLSLLTSATRALPAAETGLFMLIETVAGPLWVWLVLAEPVAPRVLIGGLGVLTAVGLHAWLARRAELAGEPAGAAA